MILDGKIQNAHLDCSADTHRPVMHGDVQHRVMPITDNNNYKNNDNDKYNRNDNDDEID